MNKKGFTLVEVVVALSVSAVILGMIVALIISVNKTYNQSRDNIAIINELTDCKLTVSKWFDNFSNDTEYAISFDSELKNQISFSQNQNIFSISFDIAQKKLTYDNPSGQVGVMACEYIKNIVFDYDSTNGLIKTILNTDEETMTFIVKRWVKE